MTLSETTLAIVGWAGVVSYVFAYGLLSLGWLPANTTRYHMLNALGGLCLVVHASHRDDIPDLAVNLIWMLIAAIAIIKVIASRKKAVRLER